MPKAKKQAEEERPEQTADEPEAPSPFDVTRMMDPEAMSHLIKAGMEMVQVMEKAMPKKGVPKEVKVHAKNIEKEFLLMTRAMIDWKIQDMDKKKEKKTETKLKKIELQ